MARCDAGFESKRRLVMCALRLGVLALAAMGLAAGAGGSRSQAKGQ